MFNNCQPFSQFVTWLILLLIFRISAFLNRLFWATVIPTCIPRHFLFFSCSINTMVVKVPSSSSPFLDDRVHCLVFLNYLQADSQISVSKQVFPVSSRPIYISNFVQRRDFHKHFKLCNPKLNSSLLPKSGSLIFPLVNYIIIQKWEITLNSTLISHWLPSVSSSSFLVFAHASLIATVDEYLIS